MKKIIFLLLIFLVSITSVSASEILEDSASNGEVTVTTQDLDKYYGDDTRFVANVEENGQAATTGSVLFMVNNQNYIKPVNDGQASMAINLQPGEYNMVSSYKSVSAHSKIHIYSTIDGDDLSKTYGQSNPYKATFLNSQGQKLANSDVNFNINGVFYTRTTDTNGVGKLNINLNPGTYTITAINPLTGEQKSNQIFIKESITQTKDLVKYFGGNEKYSVNVGSPGIDVKFNINGVFYTRTSNNDGVASLAINLRPGDYIITAICNGRQVSNTIKVLPTIIASDISQHYEDGKFSAKLLDTKGNPLSGKTMTFNINGVFYKRTTNSQGIASLSINLWKGSYIITSSYNGYSKANSVVVLDNYVSFKDTDKNNDGLVSLNDLVIAHTPRSIVKKMYNDADKNHDGYLNHDEYYDFMYRLNDNRQAYGL